MNTERARGLYTYLRDNYQFGMDEQQFYNTMEDSASRESLRRYLEKNYQFKANEQQFADMLGIDSTINRTAEERTEDARDKANAAKHNAADEEQGWIGAAWNWTKHKGHNIWNATKSAAGTVLKQMNALGTIAPVTNPYAVASDSDYRNMMTEQATHTFDEKVAAAQRIADGTATEEDMRLGAGVRMTRQISAAQQEAADAARRDLGDAEFTELLGRGEIGKALELGMITAIESAPQMIAGANTGGLISIGVLSAADEYDRLARERPDMSVGARATQATVHGASEQFWERFGQPIKVGKGLFNGAGKGIVSDQIERWAKKGWKRTLRGIGRGVGHWATEMTDEGLEEVFTSLTNQIFDTIIGWIDKDGEGLQKVYAERKAAAADIGEEYSVRDFAADIAKGWLNDFLGGALAGGYMGGAAGAVNASVGAARSNRVETADGKMRKMSDEEKQQAHERAEAMNAVVSEIAANEELTRKEVLNQLDEEAAALAKERKEKRLTGGEIEGRYGYLDRLNEGLARRGREESLVNGWVKANDGYSVIDIPVYLNGETRYYRVGVENLQVSADGSIDAASGNIVVIDFDSRQVVKGATADAVVEKLNESMRDRGVVPPVEASETVAPAQEAAPAEEPATEATPVQTEEPAAQPETPTSVQPEKKKAKQIAGKPQHVRQKRITIELDGNKVDVRYTVSKAVYNADGSLDEKRSSMIMVFPNDQSGAYGRIFSKEQQDKALKALQEKLRQEHAKEQLRKQAETTTTKEPVTATPAEEETIAAEPTANITEDETEQAAEPAQPAYPTKPNGEPDMDAFTVEQHIRYAAENGIDDVGALAQSWIDDLNSKIEALRTDKKKNPTQKMVETNRLREQLQAWLALQAEQSATEANAQEETPAEIPVEENIQEETTTLINEERETPVGEETTAGEISEPEEEPESAPQQEETAEPTPRYTDLRGEDIVLLYKPNAGKDKYVWARRTEDESGNVLYTRIDTGERFRGAVQEGNADAQGLRLEFDNNNTAYRNITNAHGNRTVWVKENDGYTEYMLQSPYSLEEIRNGETNNGRKIGTSVAVMPISIDGLTKAKNVSVSRLSIMNSNGEAVPFRNRQYVNKTEIRDGMEALNSELYEGDKRVKPITLADLLAIPVLSYKSSVKRKDGSTETKTRYRSVWNTLNENLHSQYLAFHKGDELRAAEDAARAMAKIKSNLDNLINGWNEYVERSGLDALLEEFKDELDLEAFEKMQERRRRQTVERYKDQSEETRQAMLDKIGLSLKIPTDKRAGDKIEGQNGVTDNLIERIKVIFDVAGRLQDELDIAERDIHIVDSEALPAIEREIWDTEQYRNRRDGEQQTTREKPQPKRDNRTEESHAETPVSESVPTESEEPTPEQQHAAVVAALGESGARVFEEMAAMPDGFNMKELTDSMKKHGVSSHTGVAVAQMLGRTTVTTQDLESRGVKTEQELLEEMDYQIVRGENDLSREDYDEMIDSVTSDPSTDKGRWLRKRFMLGRTPKWMKNLGIRGAEFSLPFKVISEHIGKDDAHALTKEEWRALPNALNNPFMITRYKGSRDRYRIYTTIMHGGNPVVVGVDVKRVNQGFGMPMVEVNAIKTAFAHEGNKLSKQEEILCYDGNITPEQEALLRGLNSHEYPTVQESNSDGRQVLLGHNSLGYPTIQELILRAKIQQNSDIDKRERENAAKRTIKILKERGVHINEISEEEALGMINDGTAQRLLDGEGVLYGFTHKGEVYVISERLNPNTPVHEYTHLWVQAFRKGNPKKWADMLKVLKQTDVWAEVAEDENYAAIREDEQALASEVLARLTGDYFGEIDGSGRTRLDDTFEQKTLVARVRAVLRGFWEQVGEWLGRKLNIRQSDFESRLQEIINMPIKDLMETNFDKKFKKMQEGLDNGGANVLSLQEISDLTDSLEDDIRQGNKPLVFERIPLECLQSGLGEQRTLAEALTIAALRSRRASRSLERDGEVVTSEERQSRDGSNTQMELDLMEYAKEKGLWYDDPIAAMDEQYGRDNRVGEGQESIVWADEESGRVVKVKSTGTYETLEEFLEGMVLNNWLFEDSRQTIVGFGYDNDGLFRVIYETPYVRMEDYTEMTDEQKDEHMRKFGFEVKDDGSHHTYTNGIYEVRDLHNQNIVIDSNGNVRVIDPVVKWPAGEHYREMTEDEERQDRMNEERLDEMFDSEFHIEDSEVSDIDAAAEAKIKKLSNDLEVAKYDTTTPMPEKLSTTARLINAMLDRGEGIRQLLMRMNAVRERMGKKRIDRDRDVRSLMEQADAAISSKQKLFEDRQLSDLMQYIYGVKKKGGIGKLIEESDLYKQHKTETYTDENGQEQTHELSVQEFIGRYLTARDTIERIELGIPPRGVAAFRKRMGVDMADFARQFIEAYGEEAVAELHRKVKAVTDLSIDTLYKAGMLTEEQYAVYKSRKFYVPEKGFDEQTISEENKSRWERFKRSLTGEAGIDKISGGKQGVRPMATSYRARGGDSLATDIFEHIVQDCYDSIHKAEKNNVKRVMYDLLREEQDVTHALHLPVPEEVYYIKNEAGEWVRKTDGVTAEEKADARMIMAQVHILEAELASTTDEETRNYLYDIIEALLDAMPYADEYTTKNVWQSEHEKSLEKVGVWVDGVLQEMRFPNMAEVANALNDRYNTQASMKAARQIGNVLASMCTQYNPTFFAVNIVRDTPFIVTKGVSEYGWEFAPRFAREIVRPENQKAIIKYLKGSLNENDGGVEADFYNFVTGGGQTGYSRVAELDEVRKTLKEWNRSNVSIGFSKLMDIAPKINEWSELWTRFSAYRAVLGMGMSQQEALRAAKNLSVNFNRKGFGSPVANVFSSLSMFANATIQGASGFYRTFGGDVAREGDSRGRRTARALTMMTALPAALGFIATLLSMDDDDEEKRIPDYERDNYVCIGDWRFALNEQLKPFWLVGVNTAMLIKGKRTAGEALTSMTTAITTNLLPFAPSVNNIFTNLAELAGGRDITLARAVRNLWMPQGLQNMNSLAEGKDWLGNDLRKDFGDIPEFRMSENESAIYRDLAYFTYLIGGGRRDMNSTYRKNGSKMSKIWNRNPKEVKNDMLFGIMPSGWLKMLELSWGLVHATTTEDTVKESISAKNGMFASRFFKPQNPQVFRIIVVKQAKEELQSYKDRKSNLKKQAKGGNEEAERELGRIEAEEKKRGMPELKKLIDEYNEIALYRQATAVGLNTREFKRKNPDKDYKHIDEEEKRIVQAILHHMIDTKGITATVDEVTLQGKAKMLDAYR
ncbi:MAG: hypothetical protein IJ640_00235 [Prevotella sp.]|nr:hypothetical protein [Prevotella sp.]